MALMCEMLVVVVDRVHPDPYIDANHIAKRGDVIDVREDGHQWGREEISNPNWKIIRVPGVPCAHAQGFLSPEYDEHLHTQSRMLQKRGFCYDLDARPMDYASLMAAMIRKPKLLEPAALRLTP